MCGIIGYIGKRQAVPVIMEGLKRLEYRGYDSAGIAVQTDSHIKVAKRSGKIAELEDEIQSVELSGNLGIGHTRWATHGGPTDFNAHPHSDCQAEVMVVHNGIVENYLELKRELIEAGHI